MKVLVSGAGGFLGNYVIRSLLERGHDVRAIVRPASPPPIWADKVELFRADLRVRTDLVSAFEGIDAVIHLAAATSGSEEEQFASSVVATERFLQAMSQSATKRLVHVSSLAIYDWSRTSTILDEHSPILSGSRLYEMGAYTIAKVWQERVVSKFTEVNSWGLTIMRPGFIWGPRHDKLAGMGRRVGRAYLVFGPFMRLPLTHVVNCSDGIVAALENPSAVGREFNVIDDDRVSAWAYAGEYARRSGDSGFRVPIPYFAGLWLARLSSLISKLLFGNKGKLPSLLTPHKYEAQFKPLRFSGKKLFEQLNWRPKLSFEQCLNLTYGAS
jgi:nucleoside-diphosphate-sugar epimerase